MSKYADPTREHALWLADKLAGNDYVQEAAEMLRRWPEGGPCQRTFNAIAAETEVCAGYVARPQSKAESDSKPPSGKGTWTRDHAEPNQIEMIGEALRTVNDAAQGMSEWQPIETAPKDCTVFLAYRRGQIAAACCLVRDDGEMWTFGSQSGHRDVFPEIVPTHWMPLPPPPEAIDKAKDPLASRDQQKENE